MRFQIIKDPAKRVKPYSTFYFNRKLGIIGLRSVFTYSIYFIYGDQK